MIGCWTLPKLSISDGVSGCFATHRTLELSRVHRLQDRRLGTDSENSPCNSYRRHIRNNIVSSQSPGKTLCFLILYKLRQNVSVISSKNDVKLWVSRCGGCFSVWCLSLDEFVFHSQTMAVIWSGKCGNEIHRSWLLCLWMSAQHILQTVHFYPTENLAVPLWDRDAQMVVHPTTDT